MKIADSRTMAEIDRKTIEDYEIPSPILMENAGLRMWMAFSGDFRKKCTETSRLVFLAGRGHNGGDACVMARQAYTDGYTAITVISWGTSWEDDATGQKGYCRTLGIEILQWESQQTEVEATLAGADFIFDGLTGTGLKGRARPNLEPLIEAVNRSPAVSLAVDIPSGLGDSFKAGFPAVKAEVTYTVGLPLLSLYLPAGRELCGRIVTVPICFPKEETENPDLPGELIGWEEAGQRLPVPEPGAFKNRRGHLHIYAGSPGTTGAAWLASQAAIRSMAGLVTLYIDESVYSAAAGVYRSVMVRPWSLESEKSAAPGVCLIGPGWGVDRPEDRREFIRKKMGDPESRGVLDADGLTLYGRGEGFKPAGGRWIFTPHPGELSRLTGLSTVEILDNPLPVIRKFSREFGVLLLLKCHVNYLALPDGRYYILDGMIPALGTGGSGDLLSGIIAGLLAAGASPEDAAVAGTALHQEAGRRGYCEFGWFASEDLIPLIPKILAEGEKYE